MNLKPERHVWNTIWDNSGPRDDMFDAVLFKEANNTLKRWKIKTRRYIMRVSILLWTMILEEDLETPSLSNTVFGDLHSPLVKEDFNGHPDITTTLKRKMKVMRGKEINRYLT